MSDEYNKEADEFFGHSEKDRKNIEKESCDNKTNKSTNSSEEEIHEESESIEEEVNYYSNQTEQSGSTFLKQIKDMSEAITSKLRTIYFRIFTQNRIKMSYVWMLIILIIFLISLYIGKTFFATEKPPLILE